MDEPVEGATSFWDRYQNGISILLVGAVVFAAVIFALRRPPPTTITIVPPPPSATPAPTLPPTLTPTPGPIQVYVTGEVLESEQVVTLPFGSRVGDAVAAAGGLTAAADPERVNVAVRLRDGDQVHVFARAGESEARQTVLLATPPDNGTVYVNTATSAELQQLPGIGPAMADRIVAYREANGWFAELAELDAISGIGPATLAEIAPFVSFEIR
ncbi:MAG: helix-hairpin-helix domain-containing protein [Anaerolineae bacterium]|nr:helix-hairpin-helix domain-containing protein [Anaerolineae bacterium]